MSTKSSQRDALPSVSAVEVVTVSMASAVWLGSDPRRVSAGGSPAPVGLERRGRRPRVASISTWRRRRLVAQRPLQLGGHPWPSGGSRLPGPFFSGGQEACFFDRSLPRGRPLRLGTGGVGLDPGRLLHVRH